MNAPTSFPSWQPSHAGLSLLAAALLLSSCGGQEPAPTTPPPPAAGTPLPAPAPAGAAAVQERMIAVNGGYEPKRVTIRKGQPVRLVFDRAKEDG